MKNDAEGHEVNKWNQIVDMNLFCVCLEVVLIVEICSVITRQMRNQLGKSELLIIATLRSILFPP